MATAQSMMLPSLPPASHHANTIQEGSLVIVYENINSMKAVYVSAKNTFDNRFGSFAQKDWIGLPFGSKVYSKAGSQGWVYLLAPTADLWSNVLKHRTQILYIADISMVVSYLDLRPGCVVMESGTGSGSLTHSLIRAVAPTGHVHTFEFHPERAEEAAKEFRRHGLESCVTVRQRDIEALGFPCGEATEAPNMINLRGAVDGVFLDLPAPHKAVPSAAACLRPDGRFCSFSPCIEQVQRTCEALECHGFTDLQTLECLLRVHEVRTEHLLQLPSQQAPARTSGTKRVREEDETQPGVDADQQAEGGHDGQQPGDAQGQSAGATGAAGSTQHLGKDIGSEGGRGSGAKPEKQYKTIVTSRPALDARGHTGYLTFARKFLTAAPANNKPEVPVVKTEQTNNEGADV